MVREPDVDQVERMVLAAVPPDGDESPAIAARIQRPVAVVDAAVARLASAGLVESEGTPGTVTLTPLGRVVAAGVRSSGRVVTGVGRDATVDLGEVATALGRQWTAHHRQRASRRRTAAAAILASDSDRDLAVQQLSDAFAQGRLSAAELGERTGTALAARTVGDLDAVLRDLGGLQRPVRSHPVRKGLFGVVAFLCSPFVLLGTLLLFGNETDDHVGGLVLLALFVPGLLALWRWAWPRR